MNELSNQNIKTERPDKKSFGFWLAILLFSIVITQLVRILILKLSIAHFINEKFAFSLDIPLIAIYAIYILVMIVIIIFLKKEWQIISDSKRFGFVLIIAGGVSNMIERIIFGHVVDYVFILNGVLNVADLYIIIGALSVMIDKNIFKKL